MQSIITTSHETETKSTPAAAGKWSVLGKRLWQQRYLHLMLWPGVIWMLIFSYLPMLGIQIAFRDFRITRSMWEGSFVGFSNFTAFFNDTSFITVMTNTVGINMLNLFFGFPLPIIFALLLNELRGNRFKRVIQTISYMPHFISWVVFGGLIINWLSISGLFNQDMVGLGLAAEPVSYLGRPEYFWFIAWLTNSWKGLGFSSIIYLAAIAGVDQQMYEAATIDGASRFQKVWHITLPSISNTIAILFILTVANLLATNFDQIFVLGNVLNQARSQVLDIHVYEMGIRLGRFSYATAIGLFRSVIATILLVSAHFVSKKVLGRGLY